MKRVKLEDRGKRIRHFLSMMLLVLMALTLIGAANDSAILGQINTNLSNVNETVNYINGTASPPIIRWNDVGKEIILLLIIALAGYLIVGAVLPKTVVSKPASLMDAKCEEVGRVVIIALVFLVLILAAILIRDSIISGGGKPTVGSIWAAIIILAIVFLLLIYLGFAVDGTLDQGEMRRAIAGTFVLGFTMLIFFLSMYKIENPTVVTAYLQMVGVIVGFYFGAKTALEMPGPSGKSPVDEALDYADEAMNDAESALNLLDSAKEMKKTGGNVDSILAEAEKLVKSAEKAAQKALESAKKAEWSERAKKAADDANKAAKEAREKYDNKEP